MKKILIALASLVLPIAGYLIIGTGVQITNPDMDPVLTTLYTNAVAAILIAVLVTFLRRHRIELLFRRPVGYRLRLPGTGAVAVWVTLAGTWVTGQVSAVWIQEHLGDNAYQRYRQSMGDGSTTEILLLALLAAPVVEELLFRGLMFSGLRRILSLWPAVLLSAGTFALLHGTIVHLPLTFAFGVLAAIAAERTGSLVLPVALHVGLNAGALLPVHDVLERLAATPFVLVAAAALALNLALVPRRLAGPGRSAQDQRDQASRSPSSEPKPPA